MSTAQFCWSVLIGWLGHASWAAMRRMQREIEREQREQGRDRYFT